MGRQRSVIRGPRALSPVLLLGAGPGEATCGILYLASYLRRHGTEAFVRLSDSDESDEDLARSMTSLVAHLRPRLVGISLKWYHHLRRALLMARTLRQVDPELRIVVGGNTASYFWREVLSYDCVDHVVLGDGEVPLLSLCLGEAAPPNCATRAADGAPQGAAFSYVQGPSSQEVFYSHFDQIFLSQLDQHSFSGWVSPGKGCSQSCLYCGGSRAAQKVSFGRAQPFLRDAAIVRRDHREIAPRVWQLRYDFCGGTAAFLTRTWAGLDLSRHSTTYFLWGVPPKTLIEALARTFRRVYLVLDIGCFSEAQRHELMSQGLLKPRPSDRELLEAVAACRGHGNLELEVCGIAGLPFTGPGALVQEHRLVERLLRLGCAVGYQRLEAQPGALVTERGERFGMAAEARGFGEFLSWFSRPDRVADGSVPMVRFSDRVLERAVQRSCDELQATVRGHPAKAGIVVTGNTRLMTGVATTLQVSLGDWLGRHRVPERAAREPVTVVRSVDGAGLACAPSLGARGFSDPSLHPGAAGSAILAVLAAFARPTRVDTVLAHLQRQELLDPESARELVDRLAAGRFIQPA